MTPENKDVAGLLPSSELSDDQIMDATRAFAADGGRWPSDWVDACRAVLALAAPGAAIAAREQEGKAQAAINAIAALAPLRQSGGRFQCQSCRYEWGGDFCTEGHAMNCAYVIATSVPHTPPRRAGGMVDS